MSETVLGTLLVTRVPFGLVILILSYGCMNKVVLGMKLFVLKQQRVDISRSFSGSMNKAAHGMKILVLASCKRWPS
jgi:hypothetical protein